MHFLFPSRIDIADSPAIIMRVRSKNMTDNILLLNVYFKYILLILKPLRMMGP